SRLGSDGLYPGAGRGVVSGRARQLRHPLRRHPQHLRNVRTGQPELLQPRHSLTRTSRRLPLSLRSLTNRPTGALGDLAQVVRWYDVDINLHLGLRHLRHPRDRLTLSSRRVPQPSHGGQRCRDLVALHPPQVLIPYSRRCVADHRHHPSPKTSSNCFQNARAVPSGISVWRLIVDRCPSTMMPVCFFSSTCSKRTPCLLAACLIFLITCVRFIRYV